MNNYNWIFDTKTIKMRRINDINAIHRQFHKKNSNCIYLLAGRVGTETTGAADLFSAKIFRAFFIFCLEAAFAAAFLTESRSSST